MSCGQVRDCGWDAFILAEERSLHKRYLRMRDAQEVKRRLAATADGAAVEIVPAVRQRRASKAPLNRMVETYAKRPCARATL